MKLSMPSLQIAVPEFINDSLPDSEHVFRSDEEKMSFTLELCRLNIEKGEGSGGPFSAAIFDRKSNKLVAVGVNRVVGLNNSTLHAEMVAYQMAEKLQQTFNLQAGGRSYELFTSGEPCAMCLGATPWAAPTRVVYAATAADIEKIGFNEGRKPEGGVSSLQQDNITVVGPFMRAKAVELLALYALKYPQAIYNGGT